MAINKYIHDHIKTQKYSLFTTVLDKNMAERHANSRTYPLSGLQSIERMTRPNNQQDASQIKLASAEMTDTFFKDKTQTDPQRKPMTNGGEEEEG